jgi:uncharacterized membrane protein YhaH (DUF805 family)
VETFLLATFLSGLFVGNFRLHDLQYLGTPCLFVFGELQVGFAAVSFDSARSLFCFLSAVLAIVANIYITKAERSQTTSHEL